MLPFSLLFDIFYSIRSYIILYLYSSPHLHEKKIKKIQKQVKTWYNSNRKTKLCTGKLLFHINFLNVSRNYGRMSRYSSLLSTSLTSPGIVDSFVFGSFIHSARGGWQSISPQLRTYKNKSTRININLYDILELNENDMTIKVQPMGIQNYLSFRNLYLYLFLSLF